MNLHAHSKSLRAGLLTLFGAALLVGCGSSSPSSSRATSTPAFPATTTATTPGATHRGPSGRGTKGSTTGQSHAHSGTTRSTSTSRPARSLHLHTAAIGGCSEGTALCVSKSTGVKPVGPSRIDANLVQLLARNQPTVKQAVVTCPASKSYPVSCTLAGQAPIRGQVVPIKGTITVIGLEVRTRTYAYQIVYKPAHGG